MRFGRILTKFFIVLCAFFVFPVAADENEYLVKDNKAGFHESFTSLSMANDYYNEHLDDFDNLLLYDNDKLIKMEYGIVAFDDEQDYINYYSTVRKTDDVLCSGYGADGAYLYSTDSGKYVYFKIGGDTGYTSIDNVSLIPFEELSINISSYHCDNVYLYHNIKTQIDYDYYSTSLKIDFIPKYLNNNTNYFSYDGHYFYTSFYTMIDDYKANSHSGAVNSEPYYNYYQYLSYRSLSNYTYLELEDYFYNTLGIDSKLVKYNDLNYDGAADEINTSQLYGLIDDFFAYQNVYGANGLMLISSAINESSYGKSLNSFENNNLYLTAAYQSSDERQTGRYNSLSSSIYSQAKYYVSNKYSNYLKDDYCGSFIGNKYAGISSRYSLDTYYGEKFASTYFNIDSELGLKDYNAYSLAIINNDINIYYDRVLKDVKLSINNIDEVSYVILKEYDNAYLVQLDGSLNSDYLYDYETCVGYIDKDDIAYLINNGVNDNEYVNITYDFNGGTFSGYNSLTIKTKLDSLPVYIEPSLDGYEFIGYDKKLDLVNEETTYVAQYKAIKNIIVYNLSEKQYNYLDLSGAYINVRYEDGTRKKVALSSDMLSYIDTNNYDKQTLTISYCGVSTNKTIRFIDNTENDNKFIEAIENNNLDYIKNNIDNTNYCLNMSQIKSIDAQLKELNNRNYVINDNTNKYDISVDGLDISLADKFSFSLFKDTYYVEINDINTSSKNAIEQLSSGYHFDTVCGINISFEFNFQKIDLNGPAIVHLNIEDKDNNSIYTVYHVNDDGDVVKCYTSQSNNYIEFVIYEKGDYLVLSKDSVNTYDIEDSAGNVNLNNVGFDYHKFNLNMLMLMLLALLGITGIIFYYIVRRKKAKQWRDYRRSLQ